LLLVLILCTGKKEGRVWNSEFIYGPEVRIYRW
jgi:hypothetical protein